MWLTLARKSSDTTLFHLNHMGSSINISPKLEKYLKAAAKKDLSLDCTYSTLKHNTSLSLEFDAWVGIMGMQYVRMYIQMYMRTSVYAEQLLLSQHPPSVSHLPPSFPFRQEPQLPQCPTTNCTLPRDTLCQRESIPAL